MSRPPGLDHHRLDYETSGPFISVAMRLETVQIFDRRNEARTVGPVPVPAPSPALRSATVAARQGTARPAGNSVPMKTGALVGAPVGEPPVGSTVTA